MKQTIIVIVSVLLGLLVAWVDTRPTWDDTGITVFILLAVSALLAFLAGKRPWLVALAFGTWLPLGYILRDHDPLMLLLLVIPFIGAYAGWAIQLGFRKLRRKT